MICHLYGVEHVHYGSQERQAECLSAYPSGLTAMQTIFETKRDVVFDRAIGLITAGDEQEKQILNRRHKSKRNRSKVFLNSSLILYVASNNARRGC